MWSSQLHPFSSPTLPLSLSLSLSAFSYPCVNCNARRAYKYAFLYCRTEVAAAVAFPPLRSSCFHLLSASFTFVYIWHVIWYAMPCLIWHAMPWYGLLCFALFLVLLLVPLCSVPFCSVLVLLLSVFVTLIRKMQHAWLQRRECGGGGRGVNSACNCGECVPSALLGLTWHTCPHLAYLLPFSTAKAIFMIFLSPSPFFFLFFFLSFRYSKNVSNSLLPLTKPPRQR